MAVLEKIRVKFGLAISIIIALALLSFIIDPSTIESAMQTMSSKNDVGKINGKSISYFDFLEDVDKFTKINEMVSGGSAQNEQQQNAIREAAWQSLVDKYLFVEKAKAAGINVSEAEIVALTTGDMLSPVLASNPAFCDESGNFSKEALVSFLKQVNEDENGSLTLYWNFLQNQIITQQYYAKYLAAFTASDFKSELELKNAVAENNNTSNVEFVVVPFGFQKDSSVTVSSSEIKSFYKSHKNFFKQQANRDVEYVVFEVTPSEKDINAAKAKIDEAYAGFASAENVKSYVSKNSETPYSGRWFKAGELTTLSAELESFVAGATSGVSPIVQTPDHFYAARVVAAQTRSERAYVKYIVLQGARSAAVADSLCKVATLANFSNLVTEYSIDQSARENGEAGSLGWLSQDRMIPGFEAALEATVGKPFTAAVNGYNCVLVVTEKSEPVLMKQVAILDKSIVAGKETINTKYAQANKFATLANGSLKNYRAAIDSVGAVSFPANVKESTANYGAIDNAKEVTRWVFEAKKGKVSNVITINNNYFFVVAVKDIHEEGIASLAEVSDAIEANLYAEKLGVAKAAEAKEKVAGKTELSEIAEALNSTVSTRSSVAFSAQNSANMDPAFIGAIAAAKEGDVVGPVAGLTGVYYFKVTGRDTGSFYTEENARTEAMRNAQRNSQMILPVMQELSGDVDHRARFF